MHQVEVEILGQTITAQYGTLGAGDILKTDAAFAKHLVEDCKAAKYVKAHKPAPAAAKVVKSPSMSKASVAKAPAAPVKPASPPDAVPPDPAAGRASADVSTDPPAAGAADAAN